MVAMKVAHMTSQAVVDFQTKVCSGCTPAVAEVLYVLTYMHTYIHIYRMKQTNALF